MKQKINVPRESKHKNCKQNTSKYNQHIEELKNYLWWYVLIIPVLRGLRQEDHKVEVSLGHVDFVPPPQERGLYIITKKKFVRVQS